MLTTISFLTSWALIAFTIFFVPSDINVVEPVNNILLSRQTKYFKNFNQKHCYCCIYSEWSLFKMHASHSLKFIPFPRHEITASWPCIASTTFCLFKTSPWITLTRFTMSWGILSGLLAYTETSISVLFNTLVTVWFHLTL